MTAHLNDVSGGEVSKKYTLLEFSMTIPVPGVKGLLYAILERGVRDAIGLFSGTIDPASRAITKARARQWLGIEGGFYFMGWEPFSFWWICEHLDLDAKRILDKVAEIEKQMLQ